MPGAFIRVSGKDCTIEQPRCCPARIAEILADAVQRGAFHPRQRIFFKTRLCQRQMRQRKGFILIFFKVFTEPKKRSRPAEKDRLMT